MKRTDSNSKKTTGVIYARVSKDSMDFERQVSELQEYASNNNIEVVKVFSQKVSASKTAQGEREQLQKAVEFIEENKIDKLLIWELSRLDRQQMPLMNLIDSLNKKGVSTVILMPQVIESLLANGTENPIAKFLFFFLSYYAEMEANQISARIKSKLRLNAEQGKAGGGALLAYGYKRGKNNMYEVEPNEAEIVKYIFRLLLEDKLGTERIAERLNKELIPTRTQIAFQNNKNTKIKPKGWTGTSVLSILKRTDYIGHRKVKDQVVECPAIFDDTTIWELAQQQLKRNSNQNSRNNRHTYLLAGLLKCKLCGKNYVGKRRSDYSDNYYQCSCRQKKQFKKCKNKGFNIFDLNSAIWTYVRYEKESIKHIASSLKNYDNSIEEIEQIIGDRNAEIRKAERQIEKLLDIALNSDKSLSGKIIQKKLRSCEKKIQEERQLKRANQDQLLGLLEKKETQDSLSVHYELINNLQSEKEIRDIMVAVIKEIEIEVLENGKANLSVVFNNGNRNKLHVDARRKTYYFNHPPYHYPRLDNSIPPQNGFNYEENYLRL